MSMSHWAVVAIVALVLFGRGRISSAMGEVAEGLKSFKRGMREEEEA